MFYIQTYLCFFQIEIPVGSIVTVSKAHTAKIIPNAVKIKTQGKFYLFGSLISRDNTYRLLINVTGRSSGPDADSESAVIRDVGVKVYFICDFSLIYITVLCFRWKKEYAVSTMSMTTYRRCPVCQVQAPATHLLASWKVTQLYSWLQPP